MRGRSFSVSLSLVLIGALAVPAAAPAAEPSAARSPSAKGCWYYGEPNYAGARAQIVEGEDLADLGEAWSDKISSISCHPLCTLTAYDGAGPGGAQKKINGDAASLGEGWNDKISSMSVTCRRRTRSM